jgi:hypothetical protein
MQFENIIPVCVLEEYYKFPNQHPQHKERKNFDNPGLLTPEVSRI